MSQSSDIKITEDDRLQQIARHIPGVIYQFRMPPDGSFQFSYASDGLQEVHGLSPAEAYEDAAKVFSVVHPEDIDRLIQSILESAKHLTPWYCEYRTCLPGERMLWLLGNSTPQREADGSTIWHGYIRDITDRKQSEAKLIEATQLQQAILDGANYTIISTDTQGIIKTFNASAQEALGYSAAEAIDNLSPAIFHALEEIKQRAAELTIELGKPIAPGFEVFTAKASLGMVDKHEWTYIRKDGSRFPVELSITALRNKEGTIAGFLGIASDISDRKLAEDALAESEAQNRGILQAIPDIMFRINRAGIYLEYTTSTKLSDLSSPQSIGKSMADDLSPEHYQRHMHNLAIALETGQTQTYEQEVTIAGQIQHEEVRVVPLNNREEVIFMIRDIGDRKRAETALAESEAQNRAILQSIPDIIFRVNREGTCLSYFNPIPLSDILGGKNLTSQNMADYLPPELYQRNIRKLVIALETRQAQIYEQEVTIAGRCLQEEVRVVPIEGKEEVLFIIRDISEQQAALRERKQAELILQQSEIQLRQKSEELETTLKELQNTQTHLIQSEKMSSLGQLVAGIAHEINNPVSFIRGNVKPATEYASGLVKLVRLYQEHHPNPSPVISDFSEDIDLEYLASDFPNLLESMHTGALRIESIVKSLRTFSRLDEVGLKKIDIHENIDSTLVILESRFHGSIGKPEIQLIKNYGDIPLVECYASLINQAFLNVLVNAIDAIEQRQESLDPEERAGYRGRITITTSTTADRVSIRIEDNGCGMSPEVEEKIFNPFFTTKPVGKGTGMGLATSYQILEEKHKGRIFVSSAPEEGTDFAIALPIKQI